MSKKILAGVLSAVSLLSLSVTASATSSDTSDDSTVKYDSTKGTGYSYSVTAGVSYGTVDVTLPKDMTGVIINPYGAAVKTMNGTKQVGKANKGAIASEIYTIKNNEKNDGIKVMATTAVTKVTNLVVKDMSLDKTSVKGYSEDATKGVTSGCEALDNFNPLVDYNAITLTAVKDPDTKAVTGQTIGKGGDKAAAQKKNVGLYLLGNADADKLLPDTDGSLDADTKRVNFAPKGNTTDILGEAEGNGSVFFTVYGEMNPELPASTEWTDKDSISLSVVLKVLPVVTD